MQRVELTVDVAEATGLAGATTAVTVHLPDPDATGPHPVVAFAWPGGGYNRWYYDLDLGDDRPGQAAWHTERGWIVVTCDHLNTGDATVFDPDPLTYELLAAANVATTRFVLEALAGGHLHPAPAPVIDPTVVAIGQSMGGCLTIVAQGQHHAFDAIAVLGFSAIHTHIPAAPGDPPMAMAWIPRSQDPAHPEVVTNAAALDTAAPRPSADTGHHPFAWAFHHDDHPADAVAADLAGMSGGPLPAWRSATVPICAVQMVTPGTVAPEAAAITCPVFVGVGERDVASDPRAEPRAYRSSPDVTVVEIERMAHMHNFAPTRERLWHRLHTWGEAIATRPY